MESVPLLDRAGRRRSPGPHCCCLTPEAVAVPPRLLRTNSDHVDGSRGVTALCGGAMPPA